LDYQNELTNKMKSKVERNQIEESSRTSPLMPILLY